MRIGFEDEWYFSMTFLCDNAIIAEGGELKWGFGFRFPDSRSSLWFGIGSFPQNGEFVVHAEIAPSGWTPRLLLTGHFGPHEADPWDYGLAAGLVCDLQ
jgi:hypothetical protein